MLTHGDVSAMVFTRERGSVLNQDAISSAGNITIVDSRQPALSAYFSTIRMARSLIGNRQLIWQLAWRDIEARYRGTQLGLLWSLLTPLLMLSVYTVVFCGILGAQWNDGGQHTFFSFALIAFAGLIAFNMFTEIISRAPTLIISCPNYVKKIVFPLEVLVAVAVLSALVTFFASFAILILASLILKGLPPWTIIFFPVAILPLALFSIGAGWLLASLGVYLRDIGQAVLVATQVLMFMTPIFYPLEQVPNWLQPIMRYSPLTICVENFRQVVLWGKLPNARTLAMATLTGLLCAQVGYAFFMKTKKGFADVL